jgi:hypothetical protein
MLLRISLECGEGWSKLLQRCEDVVIRVPEAVHICDSSDWLAPVSGALLGVSGEPLGK